MSALLRLSAVLPLSLLLAGGAWAATSQCAQLPAQTTAEVSNRDDVVAADFTAQGFVCPAGFALEKVGGLQRCRRPGAAAPVARNQRADCYASLELGPIRAVPAQPRPAMQCQSAARIDNVVALRGRNAGWDDLGLSANTPAVRITTLSRSGAAVPAAEDPYRQDCSPHDCRLVRLSTTSGTPADIELTLSTPGKAVATSFHIATEASCPTPAQRGR